MNDKKFNKWFNTFILVGMAVVTVVVTAIKFKDADSGRAMLLISAFGSLMGVLCTVLAANGRILTFLFGILDVSIYGIMCLIGAKYGNAALHLLYFLPMQFVGYFQWKNRGAHEEKKVQARRLSGKQWLLYCAIFLVGLIAAYFILAAFDKTEAAGVVKSRPVSPVHGLHGTVVFLDRRERLDHPDVGPDPAPRPRFGLCEHLYREVQFLPAELPQRPADLVQSEPRGNGMMFDLGGIAFIFRKFLLTLQHKCENGNKTIN